MDEVYEEYADVHKKIRDILNTCKGDRYVYRGEKRCHKHISSGLYRYFCGTGDKDDKPLINAEDFSVAWEEDIVQRAKQHFQDSASPIEVLTEMQHYGGETTLIDFTYDLNIALFFACNGSLREDGRVILFNESQLGSLEKPEDGIDYVNNDEYLLIPPTSKNARVIFQNSVFVHAPKGFIDKEYLGKGVEIIPIEKGLKGVVLDYLEGRYGIHAGTIYNDIHGFIQNNESYFIQEADLHIGFKCIERGNYRKAIKHLNQYVESMPNADMLSAHFLRGVARGMSGSFGLAKKDFDLVIKENPRDATTHWFRGDMHRRLGEYDEAFADYERAKDLYGWEGDTDDLQKVEERIQTLREVIDKSGNE